MFVEPPAPLAPLLHNTTSLRQAVDGGTLGVGYAGARRLFSGPRRRRSGRD